MRHGPSPFVTALVVLASAIVVAGQASRPGSQPARDTPAQQADAAVPKGRITGRVLAADTGRPVYLARVFLSGASVPGGRGALTTKEGLFELTQLPEGRYTLAVSKTGFITLSYGQRRPLQAGTPIQLADAQQLTGVDFRLPRGSIIAGHILDESGDPLPGATVRVLRYEYAQGNRQLVPAGAAQTDDQGAYRVWGLSPGEYYVSAVTQLGQGAPFDFGGGPPPPPGRVGRGGFAGRGGGTDDGAVGYAPTFYPGVPSANEARQVAVGLSTETNAIDFAVLLVRTARVSGHAMNSDGTAATAGNILMIPEGSGRQTGRGGGGGSSGSRIDWDGSFAMAGVAPGRYVMRARSDDTGEVEYAEQPITVGDVDLTNLTVVLAPSATIRGTVTFQGGQAQATPDASQVRVAAPLADGSDTGLNAIARVERDATFTIAAAAGSHLLRTQGGPRGWMLKAVQLDGRDVTDTPIDLRAGQTVTGVSLVFTNQLTEVNGTIADDRGAPITEYTILAFPDNESLWTALSRHIMTARPDQNGKYQIRGLPAGVYYLATVDPAEQGEWFEPAYLTAHRPGATRVQLADGEVKMQDFTLAAR